ncbi:30S ribosome-binding factor RbfA [soil metagenome]
MSRTRTRSGGGPSQRQLRVAELIRRTLSDVLARGELGDPALEAVSITVSEVRISPDLRHAAAFVLPLGGGDAAGALAALERNRAMLRRAVTAAVKLKFSPELSFEADTRFDAMDRTRALLESEPVRRDLQKG